MKTVHRFTLHLRHTISPLLTCASTRLRDTCSSGITRGHDGRLRNKHDPWTLAARQQTCLPSVLCVVRTRVLSASVLVKHLGGTKITSTRGKCLLKSFHVLRPVYTGDFCRGNSMQFLSRWSCIKFQTCSKPLRYRGDKSHWKSHLVYTCDFEVEKIASSCRDKNRLWKRAFRVVTRFASLLVNTKGKTIKPPSW